MADIIFSAAASADEAQILRELQTMAGLVTVQKFHRQFRLLYDRLSDFPASGAPRTRLGAGVRIGVVRPYVVLYEHFDGTNAVTILRIVHGRRRITRGLLAP